MGLCVVGRPSVGGSEGLRGTRVMGGDWEGRGVLGFILILHLHPT